MPCTRNTVGHSGVVSEVLRTFDSDGSEFRVCVWRSRANRPTAPACLAEVLTKVEGAGLFVGRSLNLGKMFEYYKNAT